MKTNRWLVAAVVILGIALAAQSAYLFKIKNANADKKESSYPAASGAAHWGAAQPQQSARRAAPIAASTHAGHWHDPFSHSVLDSWDPFEEMDQIQNMMNRMFRDSLNRGPRGVGFTQQSTFYEPDLDVEETADAYIVRLDLPGVDKEKINVKIQNNILTIFGERKSEKEETDQKSGFYRMESSFGSFMRSFPLPVDADSNSMHAESKNGVLTVRFSKIKNAASTAKSIPVQ
jgi:HSP20 family protein